MRITEIRITEIFTTRHRPYTVTFYPAVLWPFFGHYFKITIKYMDFYTLSSNSVVFTYINLQCFSNSPLNFTVGIFLSLTAAILFPGELQFNKNCVVIDKVTKASLDLEVEIRAPFVYT